MSNKWFTWQGKISKQEYTQRFLSYLVIGFSNLAVLFIAFFQFGMSKTETVFAGGFNSGFNSSIHSYAPEPLLGQGFWISVMVLSVLIMILMEVFMLMQAARRLRDAEQNVMLIFIPVAGLFISGFVSLIFYIVLCFMNGSATQATSDKPADDTQPATT